MTKPAPYPPDTKAKGWRFELDYERIEQSGTWALAAKAGQEARPLLLMQWLVSWRQEPCGSLPADEEVIAALIGVNDKTWAKYRKVLMRGWWQADDGLMYHPTITARVLEMLDYRRKTAERVAKHKAARREQRDGNALPTDEVTVKNGTGTGTGTSNTPTTPTREAPVFGEVFPIGEGWQPSDAFAVQAKLMGLPVLDPVAMAEGLSEFTAFWLTRPGELRTQAAWENALAQSLKRRQVKAAEASARAAVRPRQVAQRPPTPAELRVYRASPGIMDPDARARVEAHLGISATESPAVATGDFIDMEASHGNAIGMD